MTKQTKIPLPPEAPEATPVSGSMIERAVKAFDWGRLAPPPVPEELGPPNIKPGARKRKAAGAEAAEQAEPAILAEPATSAAAGDPAPVVPAPVVFERRASATAPQAPVQPEPPVVFPSRARHNKKRVEFASDQQPIDRQHLRDQGLIVPEGTVTALLEEFRIVKRQILQQAAELRESMGTAAQRVLICSPLPGEGKTYCAVNLALSMAAERESEVLLVDADFAKPSILSTLGLPGGPGLMDALADPSADVANFVIATDIPGLWVLPAGNATTADTEYLNSSRTAAVLDRLVEGAPNRMIIFDSPPALAASPAAELAKYVGQAVVVARADRTGQGALEDAISLLSACPNIQLLLNAANFSPSGRRFGTYYGYGG